MLWSNVIGKANRLQDSRTVSEKAAQQFKVIPAPGPGALETEAARLRQSIRDQKAMKMTPEQRRLAVLDEIMNREPVEPGKPHPRLRKIETLIEKIVDDPNREYGDYQLARYVWEQHQPGADLGAADDAWNLLVQRQQAYLHTQVQQRLERRSALEAELQQLDSEAGELAPTQGLIEKRIALLHGFANHSGQPLPQGMTVDDVVNARNALEAGDSSAAAGLISRASETIDNWEATIGEAS